MWRGTGDCAERESGGDHGSADPGNGAGKRLVIRGYVHVARGEQTDKQAVEHERGPRAVDVLGNPAFALTLGKLLPDLADHAGFCSQEVVAPVRVLEEADEIRRADVELD